MKRNWQTLISEATEDETKVIYDLANRRLMIAESKERAATIEQEVEAHGFAVRLGNVVESIDNLTCIGLQANAHGWTRGDVTDTDEMHVTEFADVQPDWVKWLGVDLEDFNEKLTKEDVSGWPDKKSEWDVGRDDGITIRLCKTAKVDMVLYFQELPVPSEYRGEALSSDGVITIDSPWNGDAVLLKSSLISVK